MGSRPYSYLDARNGTRSTAATPQNNSANSPTVKKSPQPTKHDTDINLLLAIRMNAQTHMYDPSKKPPSSSSNGHRNFDRRIRYAGSVYSLTLPSPSSRTIYGGIENHVIQLDLASTDDMFSPPSHHHHQGRLVDQHKSDGGWDYDFDLELNSPGLLELSAYNRPPPPALGRDQFVSGFKVELRMQRPLREVRKINGNREREGTGGGGGDDKGRRREWDERWQVATYGRMGSGADGERGGGGGGGW